MNFLITVSVEDNIEGDGMTDQADGIKGLKLVLDCVV